MGAWEGAGSPTHAAPKQLRPKHPEQAGREQLDGERLMRQVPKGGVDPTPPFARMTVEPAWLWAANAVHRPSG
jgi:hypothetical protein